MYNKKHLISPSSQTLEGQDPSRDPPIAELNDSNDSFERIKSRKALMVNAPVAESYDTFDPTSVIDLLPSIPADRIRS